MSPGKHRLRRLDSVRLESRDLPVYVVGCGGIGSFVALALAKMGCLWLHLYDDGPVEESHIRNQLYRMKDVGRPKADALADILEVFTGIHPTPHVRPIKEEHLEGIVVSGAESMVSRQTLWWMAIRHRADIPLYLDGRLEAELCRLYTIRSFDPDDVRCYERSLYDSGQAILVSRAMAATSIYTGFAIASLMADQVKKFAAGEPIAREILCDLERLTLVAS